MAMYSPHRSPSLVFAPERHALRSIAGASAYTLLRVAVGGVMTAHGMQKVLDLGAFRAQVEQLGIPAPAVAAPLALAGELLGGLGLIFGLLTPVAAFGVLAVMVVAILRVHLEHGLFAADGGFEFPLTLACAALCFMVNGGGPLSLDAVLTGRDRWWTRRRWALDRPPTESRARLDLPFEPTEPRRPSGPLPMESFPASDQWPGGRAPRTR
jgi:putative oxidoreductase